MLTGDVAQRSSYFLHGLGEPLPHLGMALDRSVDDGVDPDADVSAPWAPSRILVPAARAEPEITSHTTAVVGGS